MENTVLRSALFGYSKKGVESRFSQLESEFSKNLSDVKRESDSRIAELEERVKSLESENASLKEENGRFRAERDNVMTIMLDAQDYADAVKDAVNEEARVRRAENAALADKESARIERYRQRIDAVRGELTDLIGDLCREMEAAGAELADTNEKFDSGDDMQNLSVVSSKAASLADFDDIISA